MKLLLLSDFESDFLADGLVAGLYGIAAAQDLTIAEVPIIRHYHGLVDQGYILADAKLGFTGPTSDLIRNAPPLPAMTEEEALERWNEYDLVLMTSLRAYARDALRKLCRVSGKKSGELPLAVADGEDHDFIDFSYLEELRPRVFFKRELLRKAERFSPYAWGHDIPIWPLQFAAHYTNLPSLPEEKFVDIFCSLGRTHPTRDLLISAILAAIPKINCSHYIAYSPPEGVTDPYGLLRGRQDWDGYMKLLAGARLSVSVRGWGRDTLHYWEGFMAGTAMMVVDPGLVIPHPFISHNHYIPIESPYEDLAGKMKLYLNKPEYLKEKAMASKQHCLLYHTTEARASYMMRVAQGYLYDAQPPSPEEFGLWT